MGLAHLRLQGFAALLLALLVVPTASHGAAEGAASGPLEPAAVDRPLVAHWSFDEAFGSACRDRGPGDCDASPERGAAGLRRVQGLFGGAMRFSGRHMLRVPKKPEFGEMPGIALSAWVMPTEFEKYNEIFRKDDEDHRVLFSFQEEGTILSLGLDVGGYAECDAEIDPALLLDGRWHHCAATFDGRHMRVYLDGKELRSIERPGKITAGGPAPGCIGSSDGGECFQGTIDELRIFADALSADEIACIHGTGRDAVARLSQPTEADEPEVDRPLLAHWTFNEPGPTAAVHEATGQEGLHVRADRSLPRTRGVHGSALDLADAHKLPAAVGPKLEGLSAITFSAWARPTDLGGYREIFRQECPERLLFSFQHNGTVLSLGLNVDGYEECDARIDPARVLDGAWHHCAATFDGRTMRVYLDGEAIAAMERTGTLATAAEAPGFIGSSRGTGEYFQGALDDLRIYRAALEPAEIAALYQGGLDSVARYAEELEKELAGFYAPKSTLGETLAHSRKMLAEGDVRLSADLAGVLLTKLRARFPDDYERFIEWTGANPIRYLTAEDEDFLMNEARRLVDLMVEYKPLTEAQWQKQTPDELRNWKEVERIEKRFHDLVARGPEARFSPEWIDVLFAAGERIDFRPKVSEAVAPYVPPETPPVKDLTAEEAREALQRDWLHQAGGNPTPERIRNEIGWARELAERIRRDDGASVDFAAELAALAELEKQAGALAEPDEDLYLRVRRLKRRIALANPVVDFDKVLYVDMPFPQGKEWPHETRHRLGYMAVPGGRLMVLEGLSPEGRLRKLMPKPPLHGSFWRPDLSFDAKRVVFCFKPHNEKSFHLYEIGVDGENLRQLTDGPFDDFDPVYLPDGEHLLFSTTRGHTYVRCMPPTNAYVLARCDRDGKNIYLVSRNNEPDYLPSVMNDGRVIYTRWEYTDKPLWRAQALWTMNPDGTQVSTFWGNQTVWPDLLKDARSIPNSRRVMFTGSAHHNWFSGSVGIIDPDEGFNFPDGLTKVTADVPWPESGNGPVDPVESPRYHASGSYAGYYSPYPLGERDFLVSANRAGKFVLYLMDVDGNRELVYEGTNNIFHALPLKPRKRPPVLVDRVAWPDRDRPDEVKPGVLYSSNVYHGAPPELEDKAKYLRVLNIEHKTYTYWHKRPYLSTGPVVSIVQSEGVKRVLGTVPIDDDGSIAFRAPPGIPLHFQLLDEDYRALQTMRSFTGVMPGERRGCLGCHELHSTTPQLEATTASVWRSPRPITPPPWGRETVSYERFVQPVLDQYCGKCHQGDGEARQKLDLTFRPGFLIFNEPYVTLTGKPTWGRPYDAPEDPPPGWGIAGMLMVEAYGKTDPAAYRTAPPMTALSLRSKLIEIASRGEHNDVQVDPASLRRLIAWVDTMCPYRGAEEVRALADPEFQGVDWLAIRPKIRTAPTIVRPGPVD